MKTKRVKKPKEKTKLERDIFRVIINSWPNRSPDGQLKEIMRLFKESQTQPPVDVDNEITKITKQQLKNKGVS